MSKRIGKKGYFFIVDAFIGSTIIFLSLVIILSGGTNPTKIQYNYEMAEDYSSFLMNTKIRDLSDPYVNNLTSEKIIADTSLSIMEQVDLFYIRNDTAHATGLIRNLTEPLIPEKYGFSYRIIDGGIPYTIYERNTTDINNARIVIASKKITFLQVNSSTMWGPATAEIKIWI